MENKNHINANAFILIGGKSSRFGAAKWKTLIGEQSMLDKLWSICSDFSSTVVIAKEKDADLHRSVIFDHFKIEAPIIGLYTALKNTDSDWNLLLSCDLPLLQKTVIHKLWTKVSAKYKVIIPCSENGLEPICAFYHKKLLNKCESMILKNDYSLQNLVRSVPYLKVKFPGQNKVFTNMNTLEDLKIVKNLI